MTKGIIELGVHSFRHWLVCLVPSHYLNNDGLLSVRPWRTYFSVILSKLQHLVPSHYLNNDGLLSDRPWRTYFSVILSKLQHFCQKNAFKNVACRMCQLWKFSDISRDLTEEKNLLVIQTSWKLGYNIVLMLSDWLSIFPKHVGACQKCMEKWFGKSYL